MKLSDFIEKSLVEICEGVEQAKTKTKVAIAPGKLNGEVIDEIHPVKFKIMVTTEKTGKGEISVLPINISGDISQQNVNQIEFEVPVIFNSYMVR